MSCLAFPLESWETRPIARILQTPIGLTSDLNKDKKRRHPVRPKTRLAWSGARKTFLLGFSCFEDIRRILKRQIKTSGRLDGRSITEGTEKRETPR